MSDHQELDERVGLLEREQARQGERLSRIETDVGKVVSGMEKLLERDARRGEALSFKSVAVTCSSLAAIAVVVWWLIDTAPSVRALEKRVDRMQWQYGWTGSVERN